MVRLIKLNFILILILMLSGCATLYNPATGQNEMIFLDSATESSIGKNTVPELLKQHPLSKDAAMQERLRTVGSRLAGVSDRQDVTYTFGVLADKELNAMALPGGYVFVNQGLMSILSDDELAYVVGHEVGHVAARHIAKQMQANMTYQVILGVAFAGLGSKMGSGGDALSQGADAIYNVIALGYSRKDEYQADRIGVRYSYKAGYNPWASLTALEKIKKEEGTNWKVMGYFRSHPYVEDRIRALQTAIPEEEGTVR
jgi:predicted Zn-dependent protease